MAEWSNAAVLKTAEPETVPGVRIPLLPPFLRLNDRSFASLPQGITIVRIPSFVSGVDPWISSISSGEAVNRLKVCLW